MSTPPIASVAKLLAREHRKNDEGIVRIFQLEHAHEVRLIEITTSVPKDGEVMPFRFTKDLPDVPFESVIILIHPDDWNRRKDLVWPAELDPQKHTPVELEADNGPGN